MRYTVSGKRITFDEKLLVGRIIDRPNRFIANVEVDGETYRCHCPVTGSIGGFSLNGMPCLISKAEGGVKRTTTHTLEAFSPWDKEDDDFQWIGINQTQVNRYIEELMANGSLNFDLFTHELPLIRREVKVLDSRIDFHLQDSTIEALVEVKMPIKNLQVTLPPHVKVKDASATGVNRMFNQLGHIGEWLDEDGNPNLQRKAVLCSVFMYDNPGFKVPKTHNKTYANTVDRLHELRDKPFTRQQVNLSIDECGVTLEKTFTF